MAVARSKYEQTIDESWVYTDDTSRRLRQTGLVFFFIIRGLEIDFCNIVADYQN